MSMCNVKSKIIKIRKVKQKQIIKMVKREMSIVAILIIAVVTLLSSWAISGAEETVASCGDKLVPCAAYMNSTNPPASCCTPLKQAVEQELGYLCNLYNTPGLLQSFGVNVTQALQLPAYCKIKGDLSACSKTSTPTNSSASLSPVAAAGGVHVDDKDNSFGRMVRPDHESLALEFVGVEANMN